MAHVTTTWKRMLIVLVLGLFAIFASRKISASHDAPPAAGNPAPALRGMPFTGHRPRMTSAISSNSIDRSGAPRDCLHRGAGRGGIPWRASFCCNARHAARKPEGRSRTMAKRLGVVLYGLVAYVTFLVAFLYAIGFVGNYLVPKSIDLGTSGSGRRALLIDLALLGFFAIQHSVMARPAFKRWWTGLVPVAIERSTYVLSASLILLLLFWQWAPLPAVVWRVEAEPARTALLAVFWLGWALVLVSTFLINHFHLFGLQQVYAGVLRLRPLPSSKFVVPLFYRFIRHPIMLWILLAFWATPVMTAGHLLFAVMTTGYILVGISFEERDLRNALGAQYDRTARRVPMLIPFTGKASLPTSRPTRPEVAGGLKGGRRISRCVREIPVRPSERRLLAGLQGDHLHRGVAERARELFRSAFELGVVP